MKKTLTMLSICLAIVTIATCLLRPGIYHSDVAYEAMAFATAWR